MQARARQACCQRRQDAIVGRSYSLTIDKPVSIGVEDRSVKYRPKFRSAPLKLRPYGAIHICLLLFFDPGTQFLGNEKKLRYAIQKKYKNQAGMNLTPPPPPSQNSHAGRWHCTAESERRVADIKS